MPEIRYYTVTQEREVKVSASSPIEAAHLADKVFRGEDIPPMGEINILKPIRVRTLEAREDY